MPFFNGRFIIGNGYVRMYMLSSFVTQGEVSGPGASWVVVAGVQTGVDFIPLKFCGLPSSLALGVGALFCPGRGRASAPRLRVFSNKCVTADASVCEGAISAHPHHSL